jgi:ribonuclease HI
MDGVVLCVSCMQAVGWLEEQGASSISLYGDSSGATQVVQTLLLISHRKNTGADQEKTKKHSKKTLSLLRSVLAMPFLMNMKRWINLPRNARDKQV